GRDLTDAEGITLANAVLRPLHVQLGVDGETLGGGIIRAAAAGLVEGGVDLAAVEGIVVAVRPSLRTGPQEAGRAAVVVHGGRGQHVPVGGAGIARRGAEVVPELVVLVDTAPGIGRVTEAEAVAAVLHSGEANVAGDGGLW